MPRELLILQMERALELLKDNKAVTPTINVKSKYSLDGEYPVTNRDFTELERRLLDIRRDSIRFIKKARGIS